MKLDDPPPMLCFFCTGFASDAMGQAGAVAVMAVGVLYLFTYIKQLKTA